MNIQHACLSINLRVLLYIRVNQSVAEAVI